MTTHWIVQAEQLAAGTDADLHPHGENADAPAARSDKRCLRRTKNPILRRLYALLDVPANIHLVLTHRDTRVTYMGDFRAYDDVGVDRLALVRGVAVSDQESLEAALAAAKRQYVDFVEQLESVRRQKGVTGLTYNPRLGPMTQHYLAKSAKRLAPSTLGRVMAILKNWIRYYQNARLSEVTVATLQTYLDTRRAEPGVSPGRTVAENTIRNELYALSGVFEVAVALDLIPRNPIARLPNKPTDWVPEATWLSGREAAALLDAAVEDDRLTRRSQAMVRAHDEAHRPHAPTCRLPPHVYNRARCQPHAEALLTALLYTGGRLREVLGLRVEDIDFDRDTVWIRRHPDRALKRKWHKRKLELWPPLKAALLRYLAETGIAAGLLFPGKNGRPRRAVTKLFTRCCRLAGLLTLPDGRRVVRHTLRHTYATLMLQVKVADGSGGWVQLSTNTVARRLGHRTDYLVQTCYGHASVGAAFTNGLTVEHHRRYPAERRHDQVATTRARGHLTLVA